MPCYVSTIIANAKLEKGYHEKATNENLEDKTANSGTKDFNKYAAHIDKWAPDFYNTKKNGYAWCDIYVDYLFIKSYGETDALRLLCQPKKSAGAGVVYSRNYYINANRYSKTPVLGAQAFFLDSSGKPYHTGLVIEMTDSKVLISEGNSNNQVQELWYSKNSTYIDYGIPDYDKEPSNETTAIPTETLTVTVDKAKYKEVLLKIV